MIRTVFACLLASAAVHLSGCAPQTPSGPGGDAVPPPTGADGGVTTQPSQRAYVAPAGEITEEDYRAGRPAALMDFLFRHRQPEIPPPGAPFIELDLTELMLDEAVLTAIGTLPDLEILLLGGTNVDDATIPLLCALPRLSLLGLRRTLVTDEAIPHIAQLPSLQRLYLSETSVSDAGMVHLAAMGGLRQVALDRTRITSAGINLLQAIPGLHRLWLNGTPVSDDNLRVISQSCPGLEVLFIGDSRVSDAGITELARLTQLAVLSLENLPVTDAGVRVLAGMGSLKRVDLRGTDLTQAGVESLEKQRPDLQVFAGNTSLSAAPRPSEDTEKHQDVDTLAELN